MCTEFVLPKDCPYRISGRTMDFEVEYDWQLACVPAGTSMKGLHLPGFTKPGLQWDSKYGFLGISTPQKIDGMNLMVFDAINTEGLSAAALWLLGSEYPKQKDAPDNAKLISALDICGWAAANYASIADLYEDLKAIQEGKDTSFNEVICLWNPLQFDVEKTEALKILGSTVESYLPLHFQFHDQKGNSLVLEFRNGELEITDNTGLGVMTNAPFIDWQRTNFQNYLGVTNIETDDKSIIDFEVSKAGNGGGMIGLSCSPLPSDRFLRTAMTLSFSKNWIQNRIHSHSYAIAHTFNIIGGATVVSGQSISNIEKMEGTFTQWRVARDHDNVVLYLATTNSLGPCLIDSKDYNLEEGDPVFVPISDVVDMPRLKA